MLPQTLEPKERLASNLNSLADRVDALHMKNKGKGPAETETIIETIQGRSGTMFAPELVEAFIRSASTGSFWFYLEAEALNEYFLEWVQTGIEEEVDFKKLKETALMFSAVVDAKSTYTSEHSVGVASLARYLAKSFALPIQTCEKVELAGLLHDLGKLRVEDSILNKQGRLDAEERLKMNRHGFDSDIILRRIKGLREIARLASLHHETLDAQGYPFHLSADAIPFEARIITVADIFQALIQVRPYREGLSALEAYAVLQTMQRQGKLDARIVQKVYEEIDVCFEKAHTPYTVTTQI